MALLDRLGITLKLQIQTTTKSAILFSQVSSSASSHSHFDAKLEGLLFFERKLLTLIFLQVLQLKLLQDW